MLKLMLYVNSVNRTGAFFFLPFQKIQSLLNLRFGLGSDSFKHARVIFYKIIIKRIKRSFKGLRVRRVPTVNLLKCHNKTVASGAISSGLVFEAFCSTILAFVIILRPF